MESSLRGGKDGREEACRARNPTGKRDLVPLKGPPRLVLPAEPANLLCALDCLSALFSPLA